MWKFSLWPRNSFSGNICLDYLVCSLQCRKPPFAMIFCPKWISIRELHGYFTRNSNSPKCNGKRSVGAVGWKINMLGFSWHCSLTFFKYIIVGFQSQRCWTGLVHRPMHGSVLYFVQYFLSSFECTYLAIQPQFCFHEIEGCHPVKSLYVNSKLIIMYP